MKKSNVMNREGITMHVNESAGNNSVIVELISLPSHSYNRGFNFSICRASSELRGSGGLRLIGLDSV